MLKRIRIRDGYARKLMTVASNPVLSNRSHGNDLPSTFRALYELSRLPDVFYPAAMKRPPALH